MKPLNLLTLSLAASLLLVNFCAQSAPVSALVEQLKLECSLSASPLCAQAQSISVFLADSVDFVLERNTPLSLDWSTHAAKPAAWALPWLICAGVLLLGMGAGLVGLLFEVKRRGVKLQAVQLEHKQRHQAVALAGNIVFWESDEHHQSRHISGDTAGLVGLEPELLLHNTITQICQLVPILEFPLADFERLQSRLKPIDNLVFKVKTRDKGVRLGYISGEAIFNQQGKFTGYRGICKEITKEHLLLEKVAYQASYDALTGLINRATFTATLKNFTEQARSHDDVALFCWLSLDRFKLVNDSAGHLVGDAMLSEIARLIERETPEHSTLGRLGGDEFGLILKGQDLVSAKQICQRVINQVEHYQFCWNEHIFKVGLSMGMVLIAPAHTETELLSKAGLCCSKAKELGGSRLYYASANDEALQQQQLQIGYIANVEQALNNGQFFLAKQLIKSTASSRANECHYEILIRYRDTDGELIPPGLFIPAAEKHGLITLIDHWVLHSVLTHYADYFPTGDTTISINLSGISLSNEEFVNSVFELVKASRMKPQNICFEITETAAISQLNSALTFINRMKKLGVKFALDDFGSGVSSFGYLKDLPVDYLKIDGCLVKNIVSEPTDRAIVESIHSIARMMNMETIAEFVENDAIYDVLQEIGVDYVQGYGIGRPESCIADA